MTMTTPCTTPSTDTTARCIRTQNQSTGVIMEARCKTGQNTLDIMEYPGVDQAPITGADTLTSDHKSDPLTKCDIIQFYVQDAIINMKTDLQ